jgi:hypothetical protein
LYKATSAYSQGNREEGRRLMSSTDMEPVCANALADTLSNPVSNASFTVIRNQNDPGTQLVSGFGILEGIDQLWMMKPTASAGNQVVEFIPTNARSVRKQFIELLP